MKIKKSLKIPPRLMGECSAPLTCILYIYDLYYNRKLYVCQYVLENKINYFGKELMGIILGVICEDILMRVGEQNRGYRGVK